MINSKKRAFLFWYRINEQAITEYIRVIAVSERQAIYFFNQWKFNEMYDFAKEPIEVSPLTLDYEIGTILGEHAIY